MVIDASNSDQTKLQGYPDLTKVIQTSHMLSRVGPLSLAMLKCLFPSGRDSNPGDFTVLGFCPQINHHEATSHGYLNLKSNQRLLFSSMISGTERSAGLLKGGLSEPRSSKFKALTLVMDCLRFRWRRRMIMSSSI
ncbi:unnamed protein product [Brassica oleracea var. botrytis]